MSKILTALLCLIVGAGINPGEIKGDDMVIKEGKKVSFDYTLTVDGQVVDSSKEAEPLNYVHGRGEIIPGLALELEGLKAGDEKTIEVGPEGAYGQKNKEAFKEIAKDSLPQGLEPEADMMLQMQTPQGQAVPVRVSEVKDDLILLDLNHPLAGKTLIFDVKVTSVE